MTNFIASQMKTFRLPGVAVGIVHRDKIIYLKSFGAADNAGHQITPQSPFLIGSNSKSVTALAVMQLVEAGKINLDASVEQYLRWFHLKDSEISKAITVRHLLNHTSGLPASAEVTSLISSDFESASKEYAAVLSGIKLARPPGQAYEYCDLNYELLGMLIETTSHQPYAAYVQEHVLDPLEMQSTYLTYDAAAAHQLVKSYRYLFGLLIPVTTSRYDAHKVAAGNIASSAEDICHFLIAQLNNGVFDGHSVVTPVSLNLMHRPRSDIGSNYGMGWFIESWNGLESLNHMGMNESYSSMMNVLPEKSYGIVILTNVNSFSILGKNNLMDGVIRRLHGQNTVAYWPEEVLVRFLLLTVLLCSFAHFIRSSWKWRKLHFPLKVRITTETTGVLALGLVMITIWLVIIPIYADAPLNELLELQPDIGYGIIFGAIISGLDSLVNTFIKSIVGLTQKAKM